MFVRALALAYLGYYVYNWGLPKASEILPAQGGNGVPSPVAQQPGGTGMGGMSVLGY